MSFWRKVHVNWPMALEMARGLKIWVTRPTADAEPFATRLRGLGHEPICVPLFERLALATEADIEAMSGFEPDALLVTSRNALRSLAEAATLGDLRNVPVLAVGPGTSDLARECGFRDVRTGAGRAEDLAQLVTELGVGRRRLVFVCGEQITEDLGAQFRAAGHTVHVLVAYRMVGLSGLPDDLMQLARNDGIDAVTLFSPNAARHYVHVTQLANLSAQFQTCRHYCLSSRVAEELLVLQRVPIGVARKPNIQEMLELIGGPTAQSVH